jgi:nitrate reductase alpha subunit|tara:strand:- start:33 stop:635 length:603 start_codon:yes stop_codon:yes gene_type:complete
MEKYTLEIPNFIPSDVCDSIVQRFENDKRKAEVVFTFPVGDQYVTRNKNSTELTTNSYTDWEDISQIFLDYTTKAYNEYSKHLESTFSGYGDPMYPVYDKEINAKQILCSGFPIQRIGEGKMYDWHHDGVNFKNFIQLIFYLNTLQENQGGCTEFIDGKKVRPEVGKVLMFPCSWTFPHKGGKVEEGYKYICSTYVSTQT